MPHLLAPKFSPDGPSATVPVLGCSFPEESYPSLANQPSSGAKQDDVKCASEERGSAREGQFSVSCSLCPRGLHAQHLPWEPFASLQGPGFDQMFWETQVSSPGKAHITALGKRDRWHGTNLHETSTSVWAAMPRLALGKWLLRKGSLLTQGQEGPSENKEGKTHLAGSPSLRRLSQPEDIRLLAEGDPIYGAYTRHPLVRVEKKRCPSWNNRVRRF